MYDEEQGSGLADAQNLWSFAGPPYPPESFDRVLLDAPCSGLGQRPNMGSTWSLKEICSYQPLQRKLLQAVGIETHRAKRKKSISFYQ